MIWHGYTTDSGVEARSERWQDDPEANTLLAECLDKLHVRAGPLASRVQQAYDTIGEQRLIRRVQHLYCDLDDLTLS